MASFNTIKSIRNLPLLRNVWHTPPKSIVPKTSEFKYLPELSGDVFQLSSKVESGLELSKNSLVFDDVLLSYNTGKMASAMKHGRTSSILANWHPEYGIANRNGVFENAINKLKQDGGAIDDYLATAFPKLNDKTREEAKKVLTEYLENNLDIYSYPRMKSILSDFAKQIKKETPNAVIYVPDASKSYGIVGSLFKEVSPESKFIVGWKNLQKYTEKAKDVRVVVLDDCLVSGSSAVDLYKSITDGCKNIKSVDMYVCAAYKKGIAAVSKDAPNLNIHYSRDVKNTLEETDFFKNLVIMMNGKPKSVKQDFLKTLLRCQDTSQGYAAGTAIMFPYMAPNNNSLFSANMIQHLFTGPQFAIKNVEKSIVSKEGKLVFPPKWLTERLI